MVPRREGRSHASVTMIQIDGLGKTFRPGPLAGRGERGTRGAAIVEALADVSVAIPEGAVWAVVGPNGAGKTTLFALLLGFLHPTTGNVAIAGEEPRTYVRRHGAGYLPERFRLPPEWSVRDALAGLAALEGVDSSARSERVRHALERFGLEPHAAKPIGTLSHGLLQRLGLAQAVLADRALLVLDEPTEGLDPLWRIRFRDLIAELRGPGRTILIASHDLAEVERLADRALLLDRGRLRDILDLTLPAAPTTYRLELVAPAPELGDIFPEATPLPPGSGPSPAGPAAASERAREPNGREVFMVTAGDPAELSRRIAALIDAGGTLVSIVPVTEPLEERVRRALQEPASAATPARPPGTPADGRESPGATSPETDRAQPPGGPSPAEQALPRGGPSPMEQARQTGPESRP